MSARIQERFSKSMDMRKLNRSVSWRLSASSRRKEDAERFCRETVRAVCPVCAKDKSTPQAIIYGFQYVICKSCTHVYVRNVPPLDRLKAFYENTLAKVAMRPSEDLTQKKLYFTRVKDISLPKIDYVTKSLGKKGVWVDIGCGSGELLYAAKKRGWKTLGYEIDPQEITLAKDVFGLDVRRGYLDEDNAATMLKDADVVSFFSVLEHVPAPSKLLNLVKKYGKKNVAVVLELPRHPSVSAFVNMAFPKAVARHMLPPNHLSLFTDQSVKTFLSKSSFAPSHIWYYGQDFYELIGTVASMAGYKDEKTLNALLDQFNDVQNIFDKSKLCDEFIVIAKRKTR
ncbi:MAG: class I SAM-dependent methyltransferase [Candidatus Omnitrophica bacterium]|nr:class I SAM-dependent methyltransferase [Candidatus Omnitrophota bacterium]